MIAAPTQANATTHFLCKTIGPALDVGQTEPFDMLLLVMKTFGNPILKTLAEDIQQRLTPGLKLLYNYYETFKPGIHILSVVLIS